MSVLSSFPVTDDFEVSCFMRRPPEQGPWFAVREWDQKVIRRNALKEKPDKPSGRTINRSSEQAIRASIRQVILHMGLKSEAASREEVRMLKQHGIIGKRAPSCSLLNGEDMCRLLEAFGKDGAAQELREALERHAKAAGYTLPPPKPVPMQRRNFIDFMSKNDGLAFNPSKYRKVPPPRTRPVRERRPNLNLLSASDIDESEDEPSPDPSGVSDNEDEPVSKPGKRICSVGKKPVAVESEEEEPQEIPAAGRRRKISSASAGKQDRRGSNGLEALLFAIGVDAQDPFDQTPAGFAASDSATVGNASNSRLGTPTASGTVPALAASAAASSSSSDRYIAPSRGVNPSPPIHNSAPSRPSTHNLSLSVPPSGVPVSSVHHPPLNFSFLPSPSHLSGLWPSSSPTASSHTRLESPIPLKPGCPSPAFSLKQENAGKTPELPGDGVSVLPFGTHQSNSHGQYTLHSPNTAVPPSLMSLYGNGYNHPSFLAPSPSGSFSPQSPSPLSPTPSLCSSAASINALLQNALGAPPSGLASPVPTNLGPANIRSFLTKYNAMFGDPDLASGKGSPPLPLGLYGSEPIAVGLHIKDSKETQ